MSTGAIFEHDVTVRYSETDQMGVVHHANYLLYCEDARTAMMRARGLPYGELERSGVGLPVRQADLRYRAPALYEDDLRVKVRIEAWRAASMTFAYSIERLGPGEPALLVTATIELACIDLETKRPKVFPEELRAFLARI